MTDKLGPLPPEVQNLLTQQKMASSELIMILTDLLAKARSGEILAIGAITVTRNMAVGFVCHSPPETMALLSVGSAQLSDHVRHMMFQPTQPGRGRILPVKGSI